jgi:hypothetical protein
MPPTVVVNIGPNPAVAKAPTTDLAQELPSAPKNAQC